jgi:arylformamidase
MLIDLSHRITDGMLTYPGLPAPVIGTHLSREAAEEIYGPGITFHIGLLTICTNTGTSIATRTGTTSPTSRSSG